MSPGTQTDRNFLQAVLAECELALEELRANNAELRALLGQLGLANRTNGAAPGDPQPRLLPDDLTVTQLRAEAARLQTLRQETVRESVVLRAWCRETRIAVPPIEGPPDGKPLSRREREVLGLMVEGKSSKEVAAALGISFKTAVTHRASIMGKLNVHEIASVVREAIRRGLV
jgi:DNA-binding CsgD family transcriptional regulator